MRRLGATHGRRLGRVGGATLFVAVVLGGCAERPADLTVKAGSEPSGLARGEILVRRHCGGCHAVSKSGASPLPAAPALRDLHRRYEPETLAEALAEGILTGHPAMPEFQFGASDLASIILYLESIQIRQKT